MLPNGTVTFLLTDIEGSTQLWEKHPEEMKTALAKHDSILKESIESNHGTIIKTTGDGVHAVFERVVDAVNAAIRAQQDLNSFLRHASHQNNALVLKARMGLHTGEAELRDGDYYGGVLNRAARLMSVAYGGQTLLSNATAELLREQMPVDTVLRDLGEHRLKDLTRPEHIYQLTHPDLPSEFPPIKSLDSLPNNLPIQLTSFIGREEELNEAGKLLAGTRMLTFIGPGGTGKTRLSLQLAEAQLMDFKDGVWLIELAPLADSAYITSALASAFSLREVQGVPLIDIIMDYLRSKHLLLVLDNCEHLVEACAQLAGQILRECSKLKIIATSREALGVNGETIYRVPSLMKEESTRLFVERAMKAEPRFHLTEGNASFVAQICSRLDGIPLAIELAAARVKLFTPQQIAERLNDRFKLLTGGSRNALPRQQTLRALIDWSYHTLNETEQRTLRRLAVFSGGWTFEAAEAIIGESEALDGLAGLVNKSLVNVEEQDGASRYRFLETIRQYAMEKLVETEEAAEIRFRHLKYFMALTLKHNQMMNRFTGTTDLEWLYAIDKDYDNLRAALEWAIQSDPDTAASLVDILSPYWSVRDLNSEIRLWCKALLEKTQGLDAVRAKVLGHLAYALMVLGDMREAVIKANEGIEIARRIDDKKTLARSLSSLAMASVFTGNLDSAMKAALESEAIARQAHFKEGTAMALGMKASVFLLSGGDPLEAKKAIEESMTIAREAGFLWGISLSGMGLGRLASRLGDLEGARVEFAKAAEIAQNTGNHRVYASCRSELAHTLRQHGKLDEAEEIYKKVLPLWQDFGHRAAVAHELECLGYIANAKEQGWRAAKLLGAAEVIRKLIDSSLNGMELAEYEKEVAALRAGMDAAKFQTAWAEGNALNMEQAIEYALKPENI